MKRGELVAVIDALNDAINEVLDCWDKGDLAAAIRNLDAVRHKQVPPVLEWWDSDADNPAFDADKFQKVCDLYGVDWSRED